MTVIEGLRTWFAACPLLEDGVLHVDFLDTDAASYSIDVSPSDPVVKTYMDGSTRRQQDFILMSRFLYGADIRNQLDNAGFFEELQEYVEDQMAARNMPNIGTGRKCISISATSCGYAFAENAEYAAYQIQFKLIYTQGAR